MSADDLDDFFAKKDKKKKTKSKFTPIDLLPQQQQTTGDGGGITDVKKKKKKPKSSDDTNDEKAKTSPGFGMERDEDWIEFEEEKEADYTGLKISNLQLSKENEDEPEAEEEYEEDEDGERKLVERESGPWRSVQTSATPAPAPPPPAPVTPPESAEPAAEEKPADSGPKKYVPPSVRRAQQIAATTPTAPLRGNRFKKKEAPDMSNELEFPSLGGTTTAGERLQDRELERQNPGSRFETVRGSGSNRDVDGNSNSQKLELGNKFTALQH